MCAKDVLVSAIFKKLVITQNLLKIFNILYIKQISVSSYTEITDCETVQFLANPVY